MASNDDVPPELTFFEKLDLLPAFLSVAATALYSTIIGPFRGENRARKYKNHITHSIARHATSRLSQRQSQYVVPIPGVNNQVPLLTNSSHQCA